MRLHLTPSSVEGAHLHRVAMPSKAFYLPESRDAIDLGVNTAVPDDFERRLRDRGISYVLVEDEIARVVADYRGRHQLYLHRTEGPRGPELTVADDPFWFAGTLPIDYDVARIVPLLKYVPPPLSLVRGAERLRPGTVRTYDRRTLHAMHDESYLAELFRPLKAPVTIDDVRETLATIVAGEAARSPTAVVFLSGGSDSALLVHLLKQCGVAPSTWTAVFDTPVGLREGSLAARTAAHYDVPWRSVTIDKATTLRHLPTILTAMREPFADPALIPEAILAFVMEAEVGDGAEATAVFEGEGMDSLMCGSYKFVVERYRRWLLPLLAAIPDRMLAGVDRRRSWGARKLKIGQAKALLQGGSLFDRQLGFLLDADFTTSVPAPLRAAAEATFRKYYDLFPDLDGLNRIAMMTFEGNIPNLENRKLGVVAECAGVDFRLAFQHPQFIRLAMSIPATQKIGKGYGKRIIKDAFRQGLPPHSLTRRKSSFVPPVFDWIYPENEELLFSSSLFDQREIRRRIVEHTAGRRDHLPFLWGLLVTNAWMRRYEAKASEARNAGGELDRSAAAAVRIAPSS